uniref:Uncharacterized protein n=1 Tax=Arundo donax TaxID=35708 RepID=A0A0A9A2G4_ARUDO
MVYKEFLMVPTYSNSVICLSLILDQLASVARCQILSGS